MDSSIQKQTLATLLECGICLSLLCEPISLSCGHTYCRVCLVKSLRQHKKQCPGCREICHVSAENAAENIVIKSMAIALEPELYQQRLAEGEIEKRVWTSVYPVFFYNKVELPYSRLGLHLFEPRYKTMMTRVVNSNRAFAYVRTSNLAAGDIALIAEVKEAEFLSDGRCIVEANLCKRSRVVEHYVEDGTQGLHYCRLEPLPDDVVAPDQLGELIVLKGRAMAMVEELVAEDYVRRVVDEQYGAMPSETEAFSFWLACVSPLSERDKAGVLHSRSTSERIQVCVDRLDVYLEQRRNPRSFPMVSALGSSLASTLSALLGGSSAGRPSTAAAAAAAAAAEGASRSELNASGSGNGDIDNGDNDEDDNDMDGERSSESVPSLISASDDSSSSDVVSESGDSDEENDEESNDMGS